MHRSSFWTGAAVNQGAAPLEHTCMPLRSRCVLVVSGWCALTQPVVFGPQVIDWDDGTTEHRRRKRNEVLAMTAVLIDTTFFQTAEALARYMKSLGLVECKTLCGMVRLSAAGVVATTRNRLIRAVERNLGLMQLTTVRGVELTVCTKHCVLVTTFDRWLARLPYRLTCGCTCSNRCVTAGTTSLPSLLPICRQRSTQTSPSSSS
jgi:hypothetical protein